MDGDGAQRQSDRDSDRRRAGLGFLPLGFALGLKSEQGPDRTAMHIMPLDGIGQLFLTLDMTCCRLLKLGRQVN